MYILKKMLKNETVLVIALILALISSVVAGIDKKYAEYVDFRTLGILFCLMVVVAGFKSIGIFDRMAAVLLKRTGNIRTLFFVMVSLCFVSSMIITNDVALITFVPLTIIIFDNQSAAVKEKWLVKLVALETISANLGSMLTPIGNPQNLYLYTKSGMSIISFILTMLPYTVASAGLITASVLIITRNKEIIEIEGRKKKNDINGRLLIIYILLFILAMMVVMRVLPYTVVFFITAAVVIIFDRNILKKADYSLLLTFAAFFIFVGNIQRIGTFRSFFEEAVAGRETGIAIALSQIISNVPAALLLSGFTENIRELMIGTNIGGLGTLIASMASLISYKLLAKSEDNMKGRYFLYFTKVSVIFGAVMIAFCMFI